MDLSIIFFLFVLFLMYWGVFICIKEIIQAQQETEEPEDIEMSSFAIPIAKARLVRSQTI